MTNTYLAADFGGGSGRVMAGTIENGKLVLEEIHRFQNRQVKIGNHLYWDFLALFQDMKEGMKKAASKGYNVKSIAIDTWGVDFGLIDKHGNLIGNPVCYRDSRTEGLPEEYFKSVTPQEHYKETGIQVMNINTLFQLFSLKKENSPQLEIADKLLFMPDLFSYFLTGVANNEYSIASTSELVNAQTRTWSEKTIAELQLPRHLFGEIIPAGTVKGTLKPEIAAETGLGEIEVIAVGSHDTASAIFAVPSTETDKAFLSSGTWSLLGAEIADPILSEEARICGFTNEGSTGGKIKFLQNITGLWILQRLIAEWKSRGEDTDYDRIIGAAANENIPTVIDVDDKRFTNPVNMENAIKEYCNEHQLQCPVTVSEFVRCVCQSLASRYQKGVEQLNKCLPSPIKQLHIIGGGSQNKLINQLTANALKIPVYAGPVEATAIGNILLQAQTTGEIDSKEKLQEILFNTVTPKIYLPQ